MAFYDPSSTPQRTPAQRKAMDQFAVPRQGSATIQHELAQERKAADANTAKLRALRLAKEETDRAYALANPPAPKTRKPRKKAAPAV
jgi:hypothetical protein